MPKIQNKAISDYIVPVNMNGLAGRMVRLAPPVDKKREILFVYGQLGSLDRWWGLIQNLNRYGGVTAVDLPGFGGMDSLYKLGEKPSLDALADYLAAFVKLRYKQRRVTIFALEFGFAITTRMLQRYPDITQKVDMLVSLAGIAHRDDLRLTPRQRRLYYSAGWLFKQRAAAPLFRHFLLKPMLSRQSTQSNKTAADEQFILKSLLWQRQDTRTFMATQASLTKLDNCQVALPVGVWHIATADQNIDDHLVEQHLRVIFNKFYHASTKLAINDVTSGATPRAAAALIPPKVRRVLASGP